MRLIDLQQHFFNNDVGFAARFPTLTHDIYVNRKNGIQFTIPINEAEVPDDYADFACFWLQIEGIDGQPYNPNLMPPMQFFGQNTPEA